MLVAVPADAAESSFLRNLDTLRIASGAAWQSVTPTPPALSGNVSTINVAITVEGSEAQINRYVAGLGDLKRLFVVDNLSITPAGADAAAGSSTTGHAGSVFIGDHFSAQISGRIFSQPSATATVTTGASGATGVSRSGTTPGTGAPAPTGGSSGPTGVQNN
jgi:hypothetical protein